MTINPTSKNVTEEVRKAYAEQLTLAHGTGHYDGCWEHHWPCVTEKLLSEIERLRALLREIKTVFAGDAAPNWVNRLETTQMRGHFLDLIDYALSGDGSQVETIPEPAGKPIPPDLWNAVSHLLSHWDEHRKCFELCGTTMTELRAAFAASAAPVRPIFYCDGCRKPKSECQCLGTALRVAGLTCEPAVDWKASYEEALRQRDALTADAERYRFLRNHTWVEAYWIDGAGGVDTKTRVTGAVDHLDKAVDMERIRERPSVQETGPNDARPSESLAPRAAAAAGAESTATGSTPKASGDGWRCVTCGHENPKGVLRCQNLNCAALTGEHVHQWHPDGYCMTCPARQAL